jgi:diaminopimelate epimerase
MKLNFEKWHGCKNDFLIFHLDARQTETIESLKRQAQRLCLRDGSGVGADGVLMIINDVRSADAPQGLIIVNSDGSQAETCGNGIRVAALSIVASRRVNGDQKPVEDQAVVLKLVTGALVECRFWPLGSEKALVGADMGEVRWADNVSWFAEAQRAKDEFEKMVLPLVSHAKLQSLESWGVVETQNPHLILFADYPEKMDFVAAGKWFQTAPSFAKLSNWTGVNVHFVHSVADVSCAGTDQNRTGRTPKIPLRMNEEAYKVFVFERGVGPTQACGSGAVAIAEFLHQEIHLPRFDFLTISMPGGDLYARVDAESRRGELVGPGEFVFSGVIDL